MKARRDYDGCASASTSSDRLLGVGPSHDLVKLSLKTPLLAVHAPAAAARIWRLSTSPKGLVECDPDIYSLELNLTPLPLWTSGVKPTLGHNTIKLNNACAQLMPTVKQIYTYSPRSMEGRSNKELQNKTIEAKLDM